MEMKNHSDLSKILAKAIIKEMVTEGFDPEITKRIVNSIDLEMEFLGEQMNNIARRVRIIEKNFSQE